MPGDGGLHTTVDVVLPVLNEAHILETSVRALRARLDGLPQFDARVVIADNGSSDSTLQVAERLADSLPGVAVMHLTERGRGRALRRAWLASESDVVAYMDIDLSTDLAALGPMLELVAGGHADIAVGSRLLPDAQVTRSIRREVISRAYNLVLREALGMPARDAQCGFKALRAGVARALLPAVQDDEWFFDTELLARAQRDGYRVAEIAVRWVEDRDSRVRIIRTALADLRGIQRLRRDGLRPAAPGVLLQLLTFSVIGVLSTAAYLALFNALRPAAGAQLANLISLCVTAVANTAANRRLTFNLRGRSGLVRSQVIGLVSFVLAVALTSGSLTVLHALVRPAAAVLDSAVLVLANVVATVSRFLLLRVGMTSGRRAAVGTARLS